MSADGVRYRFVHRVPGGALVLLLHAAALWAIFSVGIPPTEPQDPVVQVLQIQEVEILPPAAQPHDMPLPRPATVPVPVPVPVPAAPKPLPEQRADKALELEPPPSAPVLPPSSPPLPVPAKEPLAAAPALAPVVVAGSLEPTAAPPAPPPVVASESRANTQAAVRSAVVVQFPAASMAPRTIVPMAEVPHTPVLASESQAVSAPAIARTGQLGTAYANTTIASTPASSQRPDKPGAAVQTANAERAQVALQSDRPSAPLTAHLPAPASTPGRIPAAAPYGSASAAGTTPDSAASNSAIALACPVQVAPDMPAAAYREPGDAWQVTAQIAIRNGVVQSVKILSGPRVFHDKVREAIRKYQCRADGGEVLATQVFRFKLGQ